MSSSEDSGVVSAEAPSQAATRPRWLAAEGARGAASELGGWLVVGLLNGLFVATLAAVPGAGKLSAHAIDMGHFALLGLASGVLHLACASFSARLATRHWLGAALLWPLLSLLAYWALKEDLSNFIERMQFPAWLPVRALLAIAVAAAYLAFRRASEVGAERILPWVWVASAFALVAANNFLLPADYPGAHLLVAACAARLAALGVRYVGARLPRSAAWVTLALALLVPVPALALGVRSPALQRLLRVPGSVVPPLLLPLLGTDLSRGAAWSHGRFPEWYRARSPTPTIPPTGSRLLAKNPIVIFLTVDALRADVVASREHDAELPTLAELRESSVRFEQARSPSPSTLTTVSSIFSGRYYSQLFWQKQGNSILPKEDTTPRLPSMLSAHGVRTTQVIAVRGLAASTGVGVGFDNELKTRRDYGHAAEVMDLLLERLSQVRDSSAFFFAHFIDPHAPYTLGGRKGTQFERYLAEVALVDHELGRLCQYLREHGLEQRTLLVVSADHGEAFGEHGMKHHAQSVYDELLRVPLLLRASTLKPRAVDTPVTLVDLGPTLLDLFGLPTPGDMMGQSLVPLLTGQRFQARRPIVADSGRRIQALVYPDGVKAIRDLHRNTQEVYDLNRDPEELRDLTGDPDFPAERYSAGLASFFEQHTLKRPGWEPPWRKF